MKHITTKFISCLLALGSLTACASAPKQMASRTVFLKQHNYPGATTPSYMISDKEVKKLRKSKINPIFEISNADLKKLYPAYIPEADAPMIGILFNREGKDYAIPTAYIYSIIKAGGKVRLLTFEDLPSQLIGLDAILLTGGDFDMPGEWYMPYTDQQFPPKYKNFPPAGQRFKAYKLLLDYAIQNNMPLLGICAGMQVMAMELGAPEAKMYFDLYTVTVIPHRAKEHLPKAHSIKIDKNSKLYSIIGRDNIEVNSRHFQGVVPSSINNSKTVKPTAWAPDGIIEAIEFPQYPNFMAVQFHPESLAYTGDEPSQKIFNAFVKQGAAYKQTR